VAEKIGGAGYHIEYWILTDPGRIKRFLQLLVVIEFPYIMAATVSKACILILYLRIFTDRWVRIATWIVLALVVGWLVTGVSLSLTTCQPFAFRWDKSIPGGHCPMDMAMLWRIATFPNIISDVAILVLPFSTLYGLKTSRARKVGLFVTFLTGSL